MAYFCATRDTEWQDFLILWGILHCIPNNAPCLPLNDALEIETPPQCVEAACYILVGQRHGLGAAASHRIIFSNDSALQMRRGQPPLPAEPAITTSFSSRHVLSERCPVLLVPYSAPVPRLGELGSGDFSPDHLSGLAKAT